MKIIYDENPLSTIIELNKHEKKELWYKIKMEQMEDLLFGAHFHLIEGKEYFNLDRARQEVDPGYYMAGPDEKTKLDERVDLIHSEFLNALKFSHCGDCTCVPCACDKCHVEELLGINTIKGLGKHEATKINGAFGETHKNNWERKRNIDEAIVYLETYDPKADWEGYEAHIPRWKAEAANAVIWLKNYRDEHFSERG